MRSLIITLSITELTPASLFPLAVRKFCLLGPEQNRGDVDKMGKHKPDRAETCFQMMITQRNITQQELHSRMTGIFQNLLQYFASRHLDVYSKLKDPLLLGAGVLDDTLREPARTQN